MIELLELSGWRYDFNQLKELRDIITQILIVEYVEIYKLENDGGQKVLAVCKMTDSGVACEGDRVFIDNLTDRGILDYGSEDKTKLFPKDGRKFLEQLKFNFKSGYLNASDIKTE